MSKMLLLPQYINQGFIVTLLAKVSILLETAIFA